MQILQQFYITLYVITIRDDTIITFIQATS